MNNLHIVNDVATNTLSENVALFFENDMSSNDLSTSSSERSHSMTAIDNLVLRRMQNAATARWSSSSPPTMASVSEPNHHLDDEGGSRHNHTRRRHRDPVRRRKSRSVSPHNGRQNKAEGNIAPSHRHTGIPQHSSAPAVVGSGSPRTLHRATRHATTRRQGGAAMDGFMEVRVGSLARVHNKPTRSIMATFVPQAPTSPQRDDGHKDVDSSLDTSSHQRSGRRRLAHAVQSFAQRTQSRAPRRQAAGLRNFKMTMIQVDQCWVVSTAGMKHQQPSKAFLPTNTNPRSRLQFWSTSNSSSTSSSIKNQPPTPVPVLPRRIGMTNTAA
ncbi:expressed unknown protein [Seminavis robusta]|uniref:Uncharacterized protein n=1 Tax=Seminavis robusta TaxID=568900 RepID=A0A9N8ELA9_9STRA|nr:expressed unknown protein [Seminavis robusta]|eukprot:Sro1467_g275140.1 n/a (327) ;mRNA; f:20672-21652